MTLAYERRGSGDPLVLVHGTASQWQVWEPVLGSLARERDVIAVDLPGFGATPPLAEAAVTPERYADAVAGLLDELGVGTAHVAGNSLGGGIALVLGARGRARSVTALSPIGFWTDREADFCRYSISLSRLAARALAPAAALLLGGAAGRTLLLGQLLGRPWKVPPGEAVGAFRNFAFSPGTQAALDGYRRWRFVPDGPLPCPVTIAWGRHDRLLRPRQADRARRAIPRARHVTLEGCGHAPMWDDPGQVARVLLEGSAGS